MDWLYQINLYPLYLYCNNSTSSSSGDSGENNITLLPRPKMWGPHYHVTKDVG
jgi:hypothetical protein